MSTTPTTPATPAGTRVRETNKDLARRRTGTLTGQVRLNRRTHYYQHLVRFDDGSHAYVTWLEVLED